ncbi:alpha/beta-hydrolase [Myriangium duriaei CBS 260.36]|uniref:Alpha/beta-hydrolase n=1 Tax=Myriangium duriaei CBS 260.36 TaxID=1168546 RepID=A0A9P4MHP9_9PEZI|nr:alpha/beta-hydrolase [Myriangium duriaei CBS 260.36]
MIADSLTVVQHAKGSDSLAPLVLLHDGGGTIYSYHALGPLHRDVYGISNPKFESDLAWEGGIPEMALTYADMIRENIPAGPVLLGGWSFGGLLALELSKIFEDDPDHSIVGLVLIDTPYPKDRHGGELSGLNFLPDIPGVRPRVRAKIHKALQRARSMVASWELPSWEDEGYVSGTSSASSSSEDLLGSTSTPRRKLPPAVLLRAVDKVEAMDKLRPASSTPLVDIFRQHPSLGWSEYDNSFINVVWDIPGDHFSIFSAPYITQVTEKILSACYYLGH